MPPRTGRLSFRRLNRTFHARALTSARGHRRAVALAALLVALPALSAEPALAPAASGAPAVARVHDHAAFVFLTPDGVRDASQRAADASENLTRVIDDDLPGKVSVVLLLDGDAQVKIGEREVFRLGPADAAAAGAASLADYAPRVQASLGDVVRVERRRAVLQHTVLDFSLVVFFAVLCWLLARLMLQGIRSLESRFYGESTGSPDRLRRLSRGPWRSLALVALAFARLLVWGAAVVLFLLATFSLFERTRPWRDRVIAAATEPLATFLNRLAGALPKLVLLLVLTFLVRAGWQAIGRAFQRAAEMPAAEGGIAPERVRPYRLLARAGLIAGALLVLPFVLGGEGGLLAAVGLVVAAAVALALLPLGMTVMFGTWLMLTSAYRPGEWLRMRLPGGLEVEGEVVGIDFACLQLVPEDGGEVRVPHLALLFTSVVHLPRRRES